MSLFRFRCPGCGLVKELVDRDARVGHWCRVLRRDVLFVKVEEKP